VDGISIRKSIGIPHTYGLMAQKGMDRGGIAGVNLRRISLNRAGMAVICRDAFCSTESLPLGDLWHSREWLGIPRWTVTHCFGEQIR
jgi:hypothetical protein